MTLVAVQGTDVGQTLQLDRVLLAGGHDFTLIGRPYVDPARVRVSATVIEEAKAAKVIAFKFRRSARLLLAPSQVLSECLTRGWRVVHEQTEELEADTRPPAGNHGAPDLANRRRRPTPCMKPSCTPPGRPT